MSGGPKPELVEVVCPVCKEIRYIGKKFAGTTQYRESGRLCYRCAHEMSSKTPPKKTNGACGKPIVPRKGQWDNDMIVIGELNIKNYRCDDIVRCRGERGETYLKCLDMVCGFGLAWKHGWRFAE